MKRFLLLSLAAMLFGWCGAYADLPDDTLWTRNVKPDYLVAADFSPDGSKVLAVAHGGLFVYETETGNLIKLWREPYQLYGRMQYAIFSKTDSRMFVRTDSNESMWNWATEELLWSIPRKNSYAKGYYVWDFASHNIIFVTPFPSEPRIIYYNDKTGAVTKEKNMDSNLHLQESGSCLSDDGKYIVMNTYDSNFKHWVAALWDLKTDKSYSLYSGEIPNEAFAFSPDGKYVAIGGNEGIVRIFDLNEDVGTVDAPRKKLVKEINHRVDNYSHYIRDLLFSPDSKNLFTMGGRVAHQEIWIINVTDFSINYKYFHPYGEAKEINISTQGGKIIAGGFKNLFLLKNNINTSIQEVEPDTAIYPNPATNIVNFTFEVTSYSEVKISIYNESGTLVETLTNTMFEAGSHTISYNCENLPVGTYFCVINAGNKYDTRKFLVVR